MPRTAGGAATLKQYTVKPLPQVLPLYQPGVFLLYNYRSEKKVIALGHTILDIAYYMLTRRESYIDLGGNYFDQQERQKVERQAIKRLERLGYKVTLEANETDEAA